MPAIEYCGCQGIALRGRCDDEQLINDEGSNVNCGNFKELIKLMSQFDSELKCYHVKEMELIYKRRL